MSEKGQPLRAFGIWKSHVLWDNQWDADGILFEFQSSGTVLASRRCPWAPESIIIATKQATGMSMFSELQCDPQLRDLLLTQITTFICVLSVLPWPTPENKKDVQQFLSFTNFYWRFIQVFSDIARPLFNLTKKGGAWTWTTVFQALKDTVTAEPVLVLSVTGLLWHFQGRCCWTYR
jgi:hypothetical protein